MKPHLKLEVEFPKNIKIVEVEGNPSQHPKCTGSHDAWNGDYDCDYGTTLTCEECKYGMGRKDPEAKCNQLK